ncbi:UDP-3-O-(3-hydroxymyristoyl)glucosamine N-acyltransferase [Aquimarina sp. MMG016]|uniref:UDP-3-O-(3-hydroxymyristoyl)glucosamine N-acyltransferase n=1 Tax=Aquimarina sp. MMG016 TaxID=2822690 RepID=UPI001B3A5978|nr:UDP-3-O-(3-hydroxymyristoyl)glucosamine N-acyltransferase [Aquimarina sp. MMG016]MBQ4820081.1 UDP-3-O-(3-hydroxymyristoyl)glucosamine N-acyltransferase [Aquimarina sp. MMG016]
MKHPIRPISVSSLEQEFLGNSDFQVKYITSLAYSDDTTITFYKGDDLDRIAKTSAGILIVKEELKGKIKDYIASAILFTDNPMLFFAKLLAKNFENTFTDQKKIVNDESKISSDAYIEDEVHIGNETKVYPNVTILNSTSIGSNCVIQSGSVLGGIGMSYVKDDLGNFNKIVQLGILEICDNVDIGSNVSVLRGIFEKTYIGEGTKIGNNVNIGHNVVIGKNCYISSGVIIGGACNIGDNCWISPGVSIVDHIKVGDGAKIGTGAVVIKDVLENSFYLGNPARKIKDL